MRVFFCAYTGFSLAIPMSSVSALTLYEAEALHAVEYKQENGNTYISLPRLFMLPEECIRHGIILKNGDDEDHNIEENRTVLLTTEIKYETEIPDSEIHPLPKTFRYSRFSGMFSGIQFDCNRTGAADSLPVLLLNPEQLVQNANKAEGYKELSV